MFVKQFWIYRLILELDINKIEINRLLQEFVDKVSELNADLTIRLLSKNLQMLQSSMFGHLSWFIIDRKHSRAQDIRHERQAKLKLCPIIE